MYRDGQCKKCGKSSLDDLWDCDGEQRSVCASCLEDEHEKLQQKIGLIPKKHSRFRIVTIADENRFIGKCLEKKETDEWLCYQVDDGSVLRFRKEHIISISEQII